jgi:hypothetical protein
MPSEKIEGREATMRLEKTTFVRLAWRLALGVNLGQCLKKFKRQKYFFLLPSLES